MRFNVCRAILGAITVFCAWIPWNVPGMTIDAQQICDILLLCTGVLLFGFSLGVKE